MTTPTTPTGPTGPTGPHTSTYAVTGMTCEHCERAVTQELAALDGVRSVSVALAPGAASTVTVVSDAPLEDLAVAAAFDEAGYELVPRA